MDHVLHCAMPIHPRTGLEAVGIVNGRPVWPIKGGSEPAGDPGAGQQPAYTPPASQADLDRIIQDRVARAVKPYAGFDDIKAKAEAHDALQIELGSTADKAAATARQEERDKANSEWTPRVVKAEFKAAAKGVLTDDQLTALMEDLDLSKYVTASGDVDDEKVAKKVNALAPVKSGNQSHQSRDLGQGNRQQSTLKPGERGLAEAQKRFPQKTA